MKQNALTKALSCLEVFRAADNALSVKDIALRTGDSLSSVQRSVFTLEALGYLERENGSGRFVPGRSILRPAYAFLRNNRFLEAATPYLIDLAERYNMRADLTVLDGLDIVYLARVPSRDELLNLSPLGRRWPAASTASGRAILAALPENECNDIVAHSKLQFLTPHTITILAEVAELIDRSRLKGYAFQREEVLVGAASVGAAITGKGGRVLGAVILGGAVSHFESEDQVDSLGRAVVAAANAISAYNL